MSVPDDKPDDIKDLLKSLYEKNVDYHNVKERVVWLAGTIYLTFSTLLMGWYLRYQSKIPEVVEEWHCIAVLSAIFALTVAFIIRQTREKVHSTVITWQHFALMRKIPRHRTHSGLKIANMYNYKKWKAFWRLISLGWSGHLILGVVGIFFMAQLTIICEVSIPRILWRVVPAVAIFLPLTFSWGHRIDRRCKIKKFLRNLAKWLDP